MSFRAKIAIAITLLLLAILGLGGSIIYIACSKYFQQSLPADEDMSCPRDSESSRGDLAELETKHGINSPKLIPVLDRMADLGDAQAAVRALRLRTINLLPEDYDTAKTKLSLIKLRYSYAMNPETTRQALELFDDAERIVAATKGKRSPQLIHLQTRRANYLPSNERIKTLDDLYRRELKSKPRNDNNVSIICQDLIFALQTENRFADVPKYRRDILQRTIDQEGEKSPAVLGKRCELATSLVDANQYDDAYQAILPAWKSRDLTRHTGAVSSYSGLLSDYLYVLRKLKTKDALNALETDLKRDWQTQPDNSSFNDWRYNGCETASSCYDSDLGDCAASIVETITKPDLQPITPSEKSTDTPSYMEEYQGSADMVAQHMITLSTKAFEHKDLKSATRLLDRVEKDITLDKAHGNQHTEIQKETRGQFIQARFQQLLDTNQWSAAQKLLTDQIQLCKDQSSTDELFTLYHNQYLLLSKKQEKAQAIKALEEALEPYDEELVFPRQSVYVLCDDLHELKAYSEEERVLRKLLKNLMSQDPGDRWECTAHLCRCLSAQNRKTDIQSLTSELTKPGFRTLLIDQSQPFPTELARWVPEGNDKKVLYSLARQVTSEDRGSAWADALVYLDTHGDKTAWQELSRYLPDDLVDQDKLETYDDDSLRSCLKVATAHKQDELQDSLSQALNDRKAEN